MRVVVRRTFVEVESEVPLQRSAADGLGLFGHGAMECTKRTDGQIHGNHGFLMVFDGFLIGFDLFLIGFDGFLMVFDGFLMVVDRFLMFFFVLV